MEQAKQIGRYEVETLIGQGGMGKVYRARDPWMGRLVAIKTIEIGGAPQQRDEMRRRVLREIRASGRLMHPNIVQVFDVGQQEELAYLVMELVDGGELSGKKSPEEAIAILQQVAEALDFAHEQGIIHRDIKPGNILVDSKGRAKVLDFGIARVLDEQSLTKTGMTAGTPHYMPPEQLRAEKIGPAADQYALAVTAYELLTGEKPFAGDSFASLMYAVVNEDPKPMEGVPAGVEAALQKGLAKAPTERYESCTELVEELRRSLQPIRTAPASQKPANAEVKPPATELPHQPVIASEVGRPPDTAPPKPSIEALLEPVYVRGAGRPDNVLTYVVGTALLLVLVVGATFWIRAVWDEAESPGNSPVGAAARGAGEAIEPVSGEEATRDPTTSAGQIPSQAEAAPTSAVLSRPGRELVQTPRVEAPSRPVAAELAPSRRVGEVSTADLNGVPMEFVWIPPGEFEMGCSPGDSECHDDEKPRHRVQITKGFELGQHEVTQAQWTAVMGSNPSRFKGADRPVEKVSWDDVQEFLGKLNAKRDGHRYRLPTEAEWEYAARAGSEAARYGELGEVGWFRDNSGGATQPVGRKAPNAWGLYDMLGNVWEWCRDWYGEGYYAVSPRADPAGPAGGEYRTLRGGSWGDGAWGLRASSRNRNRPSSRYYNNGFRCVREAN